MKAQKTQTTKTGHEIPVPKKADFMRVIKKAANTQVPEEPKKPSRNASRRRTAK